jgi:hypothetical protein
MLLSCLLLRGCLRFACPHSLKILPKLKTRANFVEFESETAKFEQQNDSKWTDLLADDWVLLGNNKNLTKTEL